MLSGTPEPPDDNDSSPPTRTHLAGGDDPLLGAILGGKFRLVELLGEGGMGSVYRADQLEPVRREVALKVIKLGMDTRQVVARFETERQALALMDHPGIAKVLDAGATETGRPFFAMELVRGISISDYCDRHRLTTRERLDLFLAVCDAVQHAHLKGVIHRDIKPSNILVTVLDGRPAPKIIDFGIARATGHHLSKETIYTERGQLIGTPEYMSPEQAEMSGLDIDTRTDIYSLGVTLYLLLTGVLPFDSKSLRAAPFSEIQRIVREVVPSRPSTRLRSLGDEAGEVAARRRSDPPALQRQLRGDLDWIVMKALDKDRARRYETVNSMALDIRRHLVREPILAHPPSALYRIRKFIARHRVGAAFALTVFALLTALGVAMAIQSVRIAEERNRAVKEAERAKAINSFLQSMLASANPMQGHKRDVTVFEAMGRVAGSIDGTFAAQPEVAAELKHTMGVTYLQLGYYEEAERMLTSSLALYERLPGVTGDMLAEPLTSLAVLFHERGDYDRAEALYRRALAAKVAASGEETTDALSILSNLALLLQDKGDLAGAEPLFRKILALDRKRLGSDHEYVANDLDNLGNLLLRRGDVAAAEPLLRESLAILEKHDSPWIATVLGNIGDLTVAKEGYAAARPTYAQAVDRGRRDLGDRNQDVAKVRLKYGKCLAELGARGEAERELSAAYDVLNASAGPENERTREALEALERVRQEGR